MMTRPSRLSKPVMAGSNITEMSPTLSSPTLDSRYYFDNVVFKVGNTIFKVPRKGFEVPGTPFEAMFSLPASEDPEGSSVKNPIVLPVDTNQFRGFLSVMYPFDNQVTTDHEWIGALELATMWMFDEIRNKAITKLSPYFQNMKSPKEAALFAKKYKVLSWLKEAYFRVLDETTLSVDELMEDPALDLETICRLLSVNNKVLQSGSRLCVAASFQSLGYLAVTPGSRNIPRLHEIYGNLVDQEFSREFSEIKGLYNDPPNKGTGLEEDQPAEPTRFYGNIRGGLVASEQQPAGPTRFYGNIRGGLVASEQQPARPTRRGSFF